MKKILLFTLGFIAALSIGIPALPAALGLIALSFVPLMPQGALGVIFSPANWVFNPEEINDMSELIFEKVFATPDPNQFHTLFTGIENQKQIPSVGLFPIVGKSGNSVCDPQESNPTISTDQKYWNPCSFSERMGFCWTDLEHPLTKYAMKMGWERSDLTGTDFALFLSDMISTSMKDMFLRLAWFNDSAAAHYGDSPAGVLINSADLDNWNCIDAFWKQIITIGTNNTDQHVTISRNAQGTYANQAFNSTDTTNQVVTGYLQSLVYEADERLTEQPDQVLIVTRSVFNQYRRERLAVAAIDLAYQRLENGMESMMFNGIQLISFPFWDRMIKTYFNNGTKYYLPHRALYTTKANLGIGVESATSFKEFDAFYDKKSKKYYVDIMYKLDSKVIEDYLVMAAY